MGAFDAELSRISKFFVDRDHVRPELVLARRQRFAVALKCGDEVAGSYTLQIAVLTAASIANRCFPGAVKAAISPGLREAPLLVWPTMNLTLGAALRELLGPEALLPSGEPNARELLFGATQGEKGALRVTFDGWIAKVGPASSTGRLAEREYCSLSGVLAAALAVSELFLSFADISVEATRREVGLSLWRPDLDIGHADALGVPVQYLPRELWLLGLGHLGNAYLWALATLPYKSPRDVLLYLNDFDKVEPENVETGLLFAHSDIDDLKSRVCLRWLERREFQARLIERPFDAAFRLQKKEPVLALCGFDSNLTRRDLINANFRRVAESGLGGSASNFDRISFHTLPNPRSAAELWPDLSEEEEGKRRKLQEDHARENPGYQRLGGDECGRYELAGKSVAVPFVGTASATLVVAEVLRLLHGGPAYTDIKLSLGNPGRRASQAGGSYLADDATGIKFVTSRSPFGF
jgi:hypothetical protein